MYPDLNVVIHNEMPIELFHVCNGFEQDIKWKKFNSDKMDWDYRKGILNKIKPCMKTPNL
jgi:hypothetical protein